MAFDKRISSIILLLFYREFEIISFFKPNISMEFFHAGSLISTPDQYQLNYGTIHSKLANAG